MPYIVEIYGGIRCDTPEEALGVVDCYVVQKKLEEERREQAMRDDKEWRWPMHQPVFV